MFINSLQNEKVLLKELSESNERAFEKIYYFYGPRIYGHVLKLVKSESFAQDLLQDIFVSIWDHRQNINPEKSFRSYLFRISENKVYDFFRKLARDKKLYEQFQ
ncbi:MAG: RNA polymerase sigma factor [Segetibacter sp.]